MHPQKFCINIQHHTQRVDFILLYGNYNLYDFSDFFLLKASLFLQKIRLGGIDEGVYKLILYDILHNIIIIEFAVQGLAPYPEHIGGL